MWAILALALAGAGVFLFPWNGTVPGEVTVTQVTVGGEETVTVEQLNTAVQEAQNHVDAAVTAASSEFTSVRVENMGFGELVGMYHEAQSLIEQYRNPDLFSGWKDITNPTYQDVVDVNGYSNRLVTELEEVVEEWVDGVLLILNTAPAGETPEERINRLQTTMGLVFSYRIGVCEPVLPGQTPESIAGCYQPGDDFYTITETGLKAGDCQLRRTLAHEYRHYEQWKEGMMILPDLPNREELEADAEANEWRGGC